MTYNKLGWEFWVAALAAALNIFIALAAEDWFYVVAFWQISIVGLLAIAIGVWRRRNWWLLLFAPVFAIPLWFGAMLLYACSQGSCL